MRNEGCVRDVFGGCFGNQGGNLGEKAGVFWVSREGCFGNQGGIEAKGVSGMFLVVVLVTRAVLR